MKCPNCGAAELVRDVRDLPYTYKNKTTVIPKVSGDFCPVCAEAVLGLDESKRINAEILSFNKKVDVHIVDTGLVTPPRKYWFWCKYSIPVSIAGYDLCRPPLQRAPL